ncbi:MAG: cysteine--tRNA ligase, partial [Candidatus Nanohaloarchaea archaeon]
MTDNDTGLRLFNTLTREKETFEPMEEGKVRLYSCGQTIYDDLHVGNARAYVAWDTLRRYLEYQGYTVRHV